MIIFAALVFGSSSCTGDSAPSNDPSESTRNNAPVTVEKDYADNTKAFSLQDIQRISVDTYAQGLNYFTFEDEQRIKTVYDIYKRNIKM